MLAWTLIGLALAADPTDSPPDGPADRLDEAPPAAAMGPATLTPRGSNDEGPMAALGPAREASAVDASVATRLVLVPGVGWNAAPDRSVEGFSTGVVAHGNDLEGVDVQWVGSWLTGTASGLQAAMAYTVAHDVHGIQSTMGLAWARGDVRVGQLSMGAAVAEGGVHGVQASLGASVAGSVDGLQASMGLNLAGGESEGVQASSGVNVARDLDGVQAGSLNVARDLKGMQFGLVNVGRRVDGVQLGLVNIAETSDVSIAPINLVKDGLHRVDVFASESAMTTVAAKIGSKHVYTLGGVGWVRPDQSFWTFGGGFGVHLQKERVWTEVDVSGWGVANGVRLVPGVHSKLRASVGLEVAPALQPFVGLSMNTWFGTGPVSPLAVDIPFHRTPDRRYAAWPGAHVGVSF